MVELHTDLGILVFDGTVLEHFRPQDASRRYHVEFIRGARIDTDRKGRHTLRIDVESSTAVGGDRIPPLGIDPEHLAVAEDLVARLAG